LAIRIQRLISYEQVPQYLHSKKYAPYSLQERYLVEESELFIIDPLSLICHVNIWLQDQPSPPTVDFFVDKILYYYNSRWKIRSIKLRHQHPAERISVKLPENLNMPILKFYLDLYYDDFGTFRNTYHSLGGVYLQIGNMPRKLRKQLRNHFIIGLVPFGGKFQDFIKNFIKEIQQLEKGFVMNVNGTNCWISGGLAMVTADLPQGNDIAGVLCHNANLGCRSCKATKNELTNISFDIYSNGRYHQITDEEFQHINGEQTNTARSRLCSQYGLQLSPGPLDSILHDRHQYIPQDAYHAIAGKVARLLDCTCLILTSQGENNLIEYWKHFEVPAKWARLPNPISHRHSFMMSDLLRILMIFPFILRRYLTINDIKTTFLDETKIRLNLSRQIDVINYLIQTWGFCAKASRKVFSLTINRPDGYFQLQKALNEEFNALTKVLLFILNITI
jgi:hypothetical protein